MRSNESSRPTRIGFTIIELMVTIAIISLLVAILLPAVQNVREAARRMQCKNNLKQIGLALHMYHDTHGRFPINSGNGLVPDQRPWQPGPHRKGTPLVHLLPFLDQSNLYNRLDFNGDVVAQMDADESLRRHVVPVLLCPSDQNSGGVPNTRAMTNYVPCIGAQRMESQDGSCDQWVDTSNAFGNGPATFGGSTNAGEISGVFARHAWASRFAEITDGLSHTIAFGEVRAECNERIHNGGWYSPTGMHFATGIPINFDSCEQESPSAAGCRSWKAYDAAYGFKSQHPAGVHVLFCGGRVKFLSDNISPRLYQQLGDRHDGEPIADF